MGLDKQTKTTILIKGALKGSQKAFSDLMELYWDDIIKTLKSKSAPEYILEDIALISFTKAFEKLESFNSEYTFKTWMSVIANNTLIDYYRKKKSSTISIDEVFIDNSGNEFTMDFKSETLSPEEELIDNQEMDEVKGIINLLPENYSVILKLRYLSSLSYKEISDKLNIPISNVKVRMMRARKLLVEYIEQNSELRN
ncbi:MAG: sigma-70 family RNA polymerase sigma factor [Flavobacteriales bacterium]|nr:sigma-70 family RNA polymerase sigma factor [Flavobacteriales bacterium]